LILNRILLNLRAVKLLLKNRWLTTEDVAESYNSLAENYNSNWLVHLEQVTQKFLTTIPDKKISSIIDLGCGTGITTEYCADTFSSAHISAVDISSGMLEAAKKRLNGNVKFYEYDMLKFLKEQKSSSTDLIVSAWAVGYSNPQKIIAESHRVLRRGGILAFIVNSAYTLQPVFSSYKKTMLQFPELMQRISIHHYPKNLRDILNFTKKSFQTLYMEENSHLILQEIPADNDPAAWLLQTGILAGFDTLFDLQNSDARSCFNKQLIDNWEPLYHSYIIFTGEKI
jgi:ubiquinone/menaquinone biosynthesis C-methylase UbiE